jgi:hypothetical protein
MQSTGFTPHPELWGRGFGFFLRDYRGNRILEHSGSRNGFSGQLSIVPEDTLGIFLICNGGNSSYRDKVIFDFLGNVYPIITRTKKFNDDIINVSDYKGTYISNRRSTSDFGKLVLQSAFVEKIKIKVFDTKTLILFGSKYRMESVDQFEISNDSTSSFPIAFGRNDNGHVNSLFLPGRSDSFQKMQWWEHELIGLITFILLTVIFLIFTVIGVYGLLRHKIKFQIKKGPYRVMTYRFIYSMTNLLFLILLAGLFIFSAEDLQYELPSILYLIFSLPIIGIITLVLFIYHVVKTWSAYEIKLKISHLLLVVLFLIYSFQLHFWNFIGFNF